MRVQPSRAESSGFGIGKVEKSGNELGFRLGEEELCKQIVN